MFQPFCNTFEHQIPNIHTWFATDTADPGMSPLQQSFRHQHPLSKRIRQKPIDAVRSIIVKHHTVEDHNGDFKRCQLLQFFVRKFVHSKFQDQSIAPGLLPNKLGNFFRTYLLVYFTCDNTNIRLTTILLNIINFTPDSLIRVIRVSQYNGWSVHISPETADCCRLAVD